LANSPAFPPQLKNAAIAELRSNALTITASRSQNSRVLSIP
jgi:hypothetical protein